MSAPNATASMELRGLHVAAEKDVDGAITVTITSPDADEETVVLTEVEARWLFVIAGPTVLYRMGTK